jgi:hypothetical protein
VRPSSRSPRSPSAPNADALVLFSVRDTAEAWLRRVNEMVLPSARLALAADWNHRHGSAGTNHAER